MPRVSPALPLLFRALALFLALAAPSAFAQVDSSFAGRTVHVYLPSDGIDSLILRNWNTIAKKAGKYWYTVTFPNTADKYNSNAGFFFSNHPRNDRFLVRPGLGTAEGPQANRFTVDDFQGKKEMWIIVDPSGPITAKPEILLEPPKIINILNPWETTGPRMVLAGGAFKTMVTRADRCGWFMAFLLKPAEMSLHFQELNGTDTYGSGGQGTTTKFDMAAEFASKGVRDSLGMNLWLDTDINSWLPTYPNKDGTCQYLLAGIVRDFSAAHPDFQFGVTGDHSVSGIVQPTIGPEPGRKPIANPANITKDPAISFSQFDKWWITDSTNANPALRSYESCYDIPMSKTGDGGWEYDSFKDSPDHSFFPVEDNNRNPAEERDVCYFNNDEPPTFGKILAGQPRNGNFCMESHATFIYQPGQTFSFRGDDDVWVFINNKLVVDLGGVHIPKSANVRLDTLNLTPGQTYKWDLFYCDREACGSSLRIKTSIFFKQQKALEALPDPANPGTFKIVKREGGKGSCAGQGDTLKEVPAVNLTYQLWDATGKLVAPLANGTHYNGSLIIATAPPNPEAKVTVDTNKVVTTLPPGNYRVVAFDAANQKVRAEVPYKVVARNQVMVHAPVGDTTVPLGTLVRVILANKFNNAVVPAPQSYVPSYPPELLVYLDAARTQRATFSSFTTDATGYDTLWVTDTTLAAADKTHSLNVPGTVPSIRITFVVPKNKVEFEPPYAGTHPLGTLVPVIAANREAGVLVAAVGTYTPTLPAGLEVFLDQGRTQRVTPGAVLSTAATGYDTLWVTGTSTATTDQSYVLAIPGSPKNVSLTFLVPKNRVEFEPPLAKDTLVGSLVRLIAANREAGALVPKVENYTLVIPPGLEVYTDAAKTNRVVSGAGGAVLTANADGWDSLWVTADSIATDYADKVFVLEIAGSPKKVNLTFRMPPLDIPKALFASLHDEDADGLPDRLVATYDRNISASLPKAVAFRWPSAAAPTAIAAADLPGKVTGATLEHRGPNITGAAGPATGGEGVFLSTYQARKRDSVQQIPIMDKMGPILLKAEMALGQATDTLRLKFSEPVASGAITGAPSALFAYKLLPDGAPVAFAPAGILWSSDGTEAFLLFPATAVEAPRAGNLVKINDGAGLVADALGNGAGAASRFRVILGVKRSEIQTITYKEFRPVAGLLEPPVAPSLQPITAVVAEVVERTGRMGHLIKTDLGDFAVGDDFTKVEPSQVTLEYQAAYFTNHGLPIADGKRTLACTDIVFQGDCLKNRGFLFVGWNYSARDGRKVGTGAVVSRLRYAVRVSGKVKESGGLDQVWGVLRRE